MQDENILERYCKTNELEQSTKALADLAQLLRTYYLVLCGLGFDDRQAMILVAQYQSDLLISTRIQSYGKE